MGYYSINSHRDHRDRIVEKLRGGKELSQPELIGTNPSGTNQFDGRWYWEKRTALDRMLAEGELTKNDNYTYKLNAPKAVPRPQVKAVRKRRTAPLWLCVALPLLTYFGVQCVEFVGDVARGYVAIEKCRAEVAALNELTEGG